LVVNENKGRYFRHRAVPYLDALIVIRYRIWGLSHAHLSCATFWSICDAVCCY